MAHQQQQLNTNSQYKLNDSSSFNISPFQDAKGPISKFQHNLTSMEYEKRPRCFMEKYTTIPFTDVTNCFLGIRDQLPNNAIRQGVNKRQRLEVHGTQIDNPKNKYMKICKVGEGAFGVVSKYEIRAKKGTYVAIKKIYLKEIALQEIKILKEIGKLNHPNILKLLDVFYQGFNSYLVLELLEYNLEDVIKAKNITLDNADIKSYLKMLMLGVNACHKISILHRDIKPGNLLIGLDGEMKLSDFGQSITLTSDIMLNCQTCTMIYRAPELLFGDKYYRTAMDMWSVGCVFGELLLRKPLFPGKTEINQLDHIRNILGAATEENWEGVTHLPSYMEFEQSPGKPLKEIFPEVSNHTIDLLSKLLTYDPRKRISANDALQHPYFSEDFPPPDITIPPTASPKD